jgi:hypothetical protein
VHIRTQCFKGCFTILAMVGCLCPLSNARASTIIDSNIGLQVFSGMNGSVIFFSDPNSLSLSTGPFTVGDYTISNITAEFVGPGFPNVVDPLQFRLTGIGIITCIAPCLDPLEIDFGATLSPASQSGSYLDQPSLLVRIGLDGLLGEGNEVPVELLIQFSDGTGFDFPVTLHGGLPFQYTPDPFGIDTGDIAFLGAFFIGCDCSDLQPGQAFSAADSISITFDTPEPATWTLASGALAVFLLAVRRNRISIR